MVITRSSAVNGHSSPSPDASHMQLRRGKTVTNGAAKQTDTLIKVEADSDNSIMHRRTSRRLRPINEDTLDNVNDSKRRRTFDANNEIHKSSRGNKRNQDSLDEGSTDAEGYNWLRRSSRQRTTIYDSLNLDVLTGKQVIVHDPESGSEDSEGSTDSMSTEESDTEEDDDKGDQEVESNFNRCKYNLRERRHATSRFSIPIQEPMKRRRSRIMRPWYHHMKGSVPKHERRSIGNNRRLHFTGNNIDSSSDEDWFHMRKERNMARSRNRFLPINFKSEDVAAHKILQQRLKIGSSLADVEPMAIDPDISFSDIGGLTHHINSLKEMILFPLMYPEVFQKLNVSPPRGVLFYGKPGTGKTLVARALANQCSFDGKRIAFFMRKGADCLSKWVGESERQLRLLFDQAYSMRPSIIFFDEIDGLAPVRSSRQDQIHSSIVSTLLALMDGLDSRGEVVVIGATNRIDAIDPALRRPGRFDREFYFPLPSKHARQAIIKIHTRQWNPSLQEHFLNVLADKCVGFCGADIKALCTEAALNALRRTYPQIYDSDKKLKIDVNSISVEHCDFDVGMNAIIPCSQRGVVFAGRPLNECAQLLLKPQLDEILEFLKVKFAFGKLTANPESLCNSKSYKSTKQSLVYRPKVLIHGKPGMGQASHFASAILHVLDDLPVYNLDIPYLHTSLKTPEETCAQIFTEAIIKCPCVLYLPRIEVWWSIASESLRATLLGLMNDLQSSLPILFLATCDYENGLKSNDSLYSNLQISETACFKIKLPEYQNRVLYFRKLMEDCFKTPIKNNKGSTRNKLKPLSVVNSPEVRQLSKEELHHVARYEKNLMRELRMFLRDVVSKLMSNRKFHYFIKPVDPEEVKDYLQVISTPMDFSTIMDKIDCGSYTTISQFIEDIQTIVDNALKYNPVTDSVGKVIRHRAYMLKDAVDSILDKELDHDFDKACGEMVEFRKSRERITCNNINNNVKKSSPSTDNNRPSKQSSSDSLRYSHRIREKEMSKSPEEIRSRPSECNDVNRFDSARCNHRIREKEMSKSPEETRARSSEFADVNRSDSVRSNYRIGEKEISESSEETHLRSSEFTDVSRSDSVRYSHPFREKELSKSPEGTHSRPSELINVSRSDSVRHSPPTREKEKSKSPEKTHSRPSESTDVGRTQRCNNSETLKSQDISNFDRTADIDFPDGSYNGSIHEDNSSVNEQQSDTVFDAINYDMLISDIVEKTCTTTVEEIEEISAAILNCAKKYEQVVNKYNLFKDIERIICQLDYE